MSIDHGSLLTVHCRTIPTCLLDFDLGSCCWDLLILGALLEACAPAEGAPAEDIIFTDEFHIKTLIAFYFTIIFPFHLFFITGISYYFD